MNGDKVKRLADISKVLNEWDVISISQYGIHCRDEFFVENFEPEDIQNTGKYMTAKAHVDGVEFYALFNFPDRANLKETYREAVNKIKEKSCKQTEGL